MGFTAELGYELFVPADRALDVYDALMEAGAEYGIRPVGVAAIMMVRLEAGMVMGEFEYDETTSPWEASSAGRSTSTRATSAGATRWSGCETSDPDRIVERRPGARRRRGDRRRAASATARRSAR